MLSSTEEKRAKYPEYMGKNNTIMNRASTNCDRRPDERGFTRDDERRKYSVSKAHSPIANRNMLSFRPLTLLIKVSTVVGRVPGL